MERRYSFKIVTYHTNPEIITEFTKCCKKFAYILHDKDCHEDGKPNDPHYHILCTFKANKSYEAVRKMFPEGQNTFVKAMTDKVGDFLYLTHKNAPEKFQYEDKLITCNDKSFFEEGELKAISNEEFLNDIAPYSMLTYREKAIKYGRDYIKNFREYEKFTELMVKEEREIKRGYNDNINLTSYESFRLEVGNMCYEYWTLIFGENIANKIFKSQYGINLVNLAKGY